MTKEQVTLSIIIVVGIIIFGVFKNIFGRKDNEQLKTIIKDGAILIDVRTPSEFSSGSVQGAINIPLNKIEQNLRKFKQDQNIIVFCRSGSRSTQALQILKQKGFKKVNNGGTWQNVSKLVNQ